MVNAIVLLKVKSDRINQVAEELAAHDGISEVYSVAGQYDLVAIIRASDDEQIATLVTEKLLQAEGSGVVRNPDRLPDLLETRPRRHVLSRNELIPRPSPRPRKISAHSNAGSTACSTAS